MGREYQEAAGSPKGVYPPNKQSETINNNNCIQKSNLHVNLR
jgi:hypothetical protein